MFDFEPVINEPVEVIVQIDDPVGLGIRLFIGFIICPLIATVVFGLAIVIYAAIIYYAG